MVQDTAEQSYLQRISFNTQLLTGPLASYLRNFRLTILLLLVVVFIGLVAYSNLPKRLNPEVKIPIVTVVTALPGAGPDDVESLITIPIENQLQSLEGLDTINSVSRNNVSVITIQFTSTTDRDVAADDVQAAVDTVRNLPEDASNPDVNALDFENVPVWEFALTTTEDIGSLQRFAKRLRNRLEDHPKIDTVTVRGLEEQEITVTVDIEKIAQYQINPLQLSSLLRANTSSYPAGTIDSARNSFSLTIDPSIETVNDVRNLRLVLQGNSVKLGDIATIEEKSEPNQPAAYLVTRDTNPKRVVTFSVFKTLTSTITDGANAATAIVDEEIDASEGRFSYNTISNTAEEISTQFDDILGEFRTTILLVFACLFIFLGLRQAVISSFTVPLTFLASFALMQVFGMSINFLTLFAFLISLGLLVDDTIVVISAMTTYYKTGRFTTLETGLLVWKDTIVPIWSTTLTTIWSFVPLLLATGIIGEFIKPIPVVVTVTMVSSTAIAVLITLPIMMLILKPSIPRRVIVLSKGIVLLLLFSLIAAIAGVNPVLIPVGILFVLIVAVFFRVRSILSQYVITLIHRVPGYSRITKFIVYSSNHGVVSLDGFSQSYKRLMLRILSSKSARRKVVFAIVVYSFIGFLLIPFGFVKNEFFPKVDGNRIFLDVEMPSGTTLERVEQETLAVLDRVKSNPYATYLLAQIGTSAPTGFEGGGDSSNKGLITMHFPPEEKRPVSSIEIAEDLRNEFKEYARAQVSVVELSGGPPAGADIQIELLGDDLSILNQYADRIEEYLKKQPGITNTAKSINEGTSAIVFVPDQDSVAQRGLTMDTLGLWTRIYGSGFTLQEVNFDDGQAEKVPVRFTFGSDNPTPESLGRLSVITPQGDVPLLSLGRLELKPNPTQITRVNGKRSITVTAGARPGFSVADLGKDLESFAQSLNLPEGYNWQTGGVNEENAKSIQSILQAMGVSVLLILVTMVLQFGSFRQAVLVLLVIPLAVSSVFYAFAITGTPLSFPALIGVLSLFGIVVTNSMFIVDKVNLNLKEGMQFEESLADAGASRMEPIILTKLSTVFGLLPITLADPLWRGLGGAIISGLLIASIIMLLFIPVVYYQWFKQKIN